MSEALQKRIAAGESETTAFVATIRSAQKIGRIICSMLNGAGGAIFCGVDDNGGIVGIKGADRARALDLETSLKADISPLALFTVSCVDLGEASIFLIEVPQGKDPPYVMEGGVWLRSDATTKSADIDTLRQLLKVQAETPIRWERRASPSMGEDDLDIDEVRATVRDAESKRFKFLDPSDDRQVLNQLGARDASGFTQGGDILFSRFPSQRHPQCRAQLIVYASDKVGDAFRDNRWFEGPIVRVCRELIAAVDAANPLRSDFSQDDVLRGDRSAYDMNAIREGLVNAFVHRDYAAYSGGLKVSLYPSRIEIWNSGRLPEGVTVSALRRQHESIPTNPDIAHVFYLRDMMEQVGRGTELIIRRSKELGAPTPTWKDASTGVTLTIYASTREPDRNTWLNPRQAKLLAETEDNEVFSLRTYQTLYAPDVTERQARRDLNELEKRGLVRQQGRGSHTSYVKLAPG